MSDEIARRIEEMERRHGAKEAPSEADNVVPMVGPEGAFLSEVMAVVDRHKANITALQICGGLFSASVYVLKANTDEEESE